MWIKTQKWEHIRPVWDTEEVYVGMEEEGKPTEKKVGLNIIEGPLAMIYCQVYYPSIFTFHPCNKQKTLLSRLLFTKIPVPFPLCSVSAGERLPRRVLPYFLGPFTFVGAKCLFSTMKCLCTFQANVVRSTCALSTMDYRRRKAVNKGLQGPTGERVTR